MKIVAESDDGRMYKMEIVTPRGVAHIPMKMSSFTPLQNGNLTVLKADVVDILE